MRAIKAFVSVRDRYEATAACLASLRDTDESAEVAVIVYDMGSTDERLFRLYDEQLAAGTLAAVERFSLEQLSGIYWSKNFAWSRFLDSTPAGECEFVAMVDNDVQAVSGWSGACRGLLASQEARERRIVVVSPTDRVPLAGRIVESFDLDGRRVIVRRKSLSRFWLARAETFLALPRPTADKVKRFGVEDRMPTDAHYWQEFEARGLLFASFDPPICREIEVESSRRIFQIGADMRHKRRPACA